MARRPRDLAHLALLLYVVSLALPALSLHDKPVFGSGEGSVRVLFGAQCLLTGWAVWQGWLANPLFAVGYLLHRRRRQGAAAVVLVLAMASAILGPVILHDLQFLRLESLLVGYVVWFASFIVLLVAVARPPRLRADVSPSPHDA